MSSQKSALTSVNYKLHKSSNSQSNHKWKLNPFEGCYTGAFHDLEIEIFDELLEIVSHWPLFTSKFCTRAMRYFRYTCFSVILLFCAKIVVWDLSASDQRVPIATLVHEPSTLQRLRQKVHKKIDPLLVILCSFHQKSLCAFESVWKAKMSLKIARMRLRGRRAVTYFGLRAAAW